MRVFVINDFMSPAVPCVHPHHDVLALPGMVVNPCWLFPFRLPQERFEHFRCWFVLGCKDGQRCAAFQAELGILLGKHGSHLLKFMCNVARLTLAAVRKHAEVRTADFNPGLLAGQAGNDSCQKKDSFELESEAHARANFDAFWQKRQ